MDLGLKGKTVLVTGASKGIGLACARGFALEGAFPTVVSRSAEALAKAAAGIEKETGVKVKTIAADLSKSDAQAKVAAEAGDCDILVNNAGAIPAGNLDQIDEARWREAWDLKVFGYINLTRLVLAKMAARKSGVICNVIGMAAAAPKADYIAGGVGNSALVAFTNAIGGASPRNNVRVFGVSPGATKTDRIITMQKQRAKTLLGDENRWEELLSDLPFGRIMTAEEAANVVVFGSSAAASYLSGCVINLDGGAVNAPAKK